MLQTILVAVLAVIATILVLAARQPDEFSVSRSLHMNATPEAILAQVNDQKAWQAWSPWVKMDPQAIYTFEGPQAGVGATVRWVGTKTGQGSSTIVASEPNVVRFTLEFVKPMAATNSTEFLLTPEAGGTKVTWTMSGPATYMSKLMGVVMNCERMVGEQFAEGLANLKTIVETR